MDNRDFQHHVTIQVRNYEVDWQGIVHNANILLYFEHGRISYLKDLGISIDLSSVTHESNIVVVRNEVDYFSSVRFGQILDVRTRISYVRNTSFAFEGILLDSATGSVVATNLSVHVWLDQQTNKPMQVPAHFRKKVHELEGPNTEIFWPDRSL